MKPSWYPRPCCARCAGEVLQRERDGLLQLVEELRGKGGSARPAGLPAYRRGSAAYPAQPPAARPPATSAAARNGMLVAGGSSFNAMVRALKQDLLATGTLRRNRPALYEVDQVGGLIVGVGLVKISSTCLLEFKGLKWTGLTTPS